jgi:hypothetical protein
MLEKRRLQVAALQKLKTTGDKKLQRTQLMVEQSTEQIEALRNAHDMLQQQHNYLLVSSNEAIARLTHEVHALTHTARADKQHAAQLTHKHNQTLAQMGAISRELRALDARLAQLKSLKVRRSELPATLMRGGVEIMNPLIGLPIDYAEEIASISAHTKLIMSQCLDTHTRMSVGATRAGPSPRHSSLRLLSATTPPPRNDAQTPTPRPPPTPPEYQTPPHAPTSRQPPHTVS